MHIHLTLPAIASLATIMLIGALVPSVSVLAVTTRSAAHGFSHGALTALGIVTGDLIFILIAIYGLALLAAALGDHFDLIRYIGGAYLIWLGFAFWHSRPAQAAARSSAASARSSFLTGLLITLADQKAILFYLGFFPAFVDLATLTLADTGIILAVAAFAVGAPKLLYAWLAERAGRLLHSKRMTRMLQAVAGTTLIGVGLVLIART